jgi:hypothetical protein
MACLQSVAPLGGVRALDDPLHGEGKFTRTAILLCMVILIAGIAVRLAQHPYIIEGLLDGARNWLIRFYSYLG